MKKTFSALCTAAMVLASLGASMAPANAQGVSVQLFGNSNTNQCTERDRGNYDLRGFERRGGNYYYNGYQGFRERRAGYRQYNGYWFPRSAFSFNITIDSDRNSRADRNSVRLTRQHIAWCEDRYRSYRASDNTFQPFNGARRQCISPYLG